MKLKVTEDPILLKNQSKGLEDLFLCVSFCAQMAQHDLFRTHAALLPYMIKEPGCLLIFHMKSAIVIGVFPQELGIVIGLDKDKIGIDAMLDKSFPIVKVRHDDDFASDPVLTTVNDKAEIRAVWLMGNRYGTEEEFSDTERRI